MLLNSQRHSPQIIVAGFIAWAILLVAGFWRLFIYANTPERPAIKANSWPTDTQISYRGNLPQLLIFVHPYCPCSRATLGELARLMPHILGKIEPIVIFYKPLTRSESWVKSSLWQTARTTPGVRIVFDDDGREARRFGAQTSGQVLVYGAQKHLIFSGGITPGRGHQGDNDGRRAVLNIASGSVPKTLSTPVFGCSLTSPEKTASKGNDELD